MKTNLSANKEKFDRQVKELRRKLEECKKKEL